MEHAAARNAPADLPPPAADAAVAAPPPPSEVFAKALAALGPNPGRAALGQMLALGWAAYHAAGSLQERRPLRLALARLLLAYSLTPDTPASTPAPEAAPARRKPRKRKAAADIVPDAIPVPLAEALAAHISDTADETPDEVIEPLSPDARLPDGDG